MPYSETFKDHLLNPRNAGELDAPDASAELTNPVCGDRLRLTLRIREGRVAEARFLAYGCPPTIACGSALTELVAGRTLAECLTLERREVARAAGGLPARRQHAAALAVETLRTAVERFSA
ncbi:MAG TPA: iron-sulfur cluster assembly scaffold protein [Pyrinomonadaceae bacterium]|nr:iron-sulfur cluster assembly scaffold protein [Pyrinomonadaceae bacterium]